MNTFCSSAIIRFVLVSFCCAGFVPAARAADAKPEVTASRKPEKGCTWGKVDSAEAAASVIVQQCDFGFRKIRHSFDGNKLVEKYSDSGPDSPGDKVIEVFSKEESETPAAALKRQFFDKLDDYEKLHCVVKPANVKDELEKPFRDKTKSAWVIEPDNIYAAKIKSETQEGDMPEDSCGEYGMPVDSRAYFEFHAGSKSHFAWVSAGQDTPLFDEQSLAF